MHACLRNVSTYTFTYVEAGTWRQEYTHPHTATHRHGQAHKDAQTYIPIYGHCKYVQYEVLWKAFDILGSIASRFWRYTIVYIHNLFSWEKVPSLLSASVKSDGGSLCLQFRILFIVSEFLGTKQFALSLRRVWVRYEYVLMQTNVPFQSISIYCNHKPANKASDYVKTITCMDVIWLIGLGARKIQNFEGGRALPTETWISNAVMDDMKCDEMYL